MSKYSNKSGAGVASAAAVQGSYAAVFSERQQRPAGDVPSPRSSSRSAREPANGGAHRDGHGWNKSVRVEKRSVVNGVEARPAPATQGRPSSPTARRFHSPREDPLNAPADGEPQSPVAQANSNGAPAWQTRALFMSANDLAGASGAAPVNVAATVASTPRTGASQAVLVQQLRDVVLKLSQGAAEETQEAVNTQKRFEAYTELVHEQDRIINELRNDNARLQRERDTLLEFRHQNLQRDMRLLSGVSEENASLTKTPMLDELIQLEFAKSNGMTQPASAALVSDSLTPQSRNLVRSLAAQLFDERTRRLDVEEKSSMLVGQQQSMIDTLEQRLNRAERSPQRSPRFARYANSGGRAPSTTARVLPSATTAAGGTTDDAAATTPRRGDLDSPTLSSDSGSSHSASSSHHDSPMRAGANYPRRYSAPMNTAQRRVVGQLSHELESPKYTHGGVSPSSRSRATPPLSPRPARQSDDSLTPRGRHLSLNKDAADMSPSEAYEDANTILSAIRQKYGL